MQPAIPVPTAVFEAAMHLAPACYFRPGGLDPYIKGLLERCQTVFDIAALLRADLDHSSVCRHDGYGGVVEDGALLQGKVMIQTGARIEAGAEVVGPVMVCAGAVVAAGARVRDHTVVGPGCRIGFGAEITRSLLAGHVTMEHPCFIGDSVFGQRVNVGSFCSTTGQTKLGAFVGDDVALPAGTVLSPGTLIGPGAVVHPRDRSRQPPAWPGPPDTGRLR